MSNLKPCPFCGGNADYHETDKSKWLVECQSCIISTSVPTHGKEMAAEYWNRRTPIDPEQIMRDNITTHNEPLRANMDEKAYQVGYTGGVLSMYADAGENASFAQGRKDRQREKGDE